MHEDPKSSHRAAVVAFLGTVCFAALYLWPDVSGETGRPWSWLETLQDLNFDKLVHITMSLLLATSYGRALIGLQPSGPEVKGRHRRIPRLQSWALDWIAAGSALFYSGILEIAQRWVPGRSPSIADFIANTVGVLLFVGLARSGVFRPARDRLR